MNREELIELVRKIQNVDGTESEIDYMIELVERSVPDPDISDYIFELEYEELTAEEIIDKALAFIPIQLPSGQSEQKIESTGEEE